MKPRPLILTALFAALTAVGAMLRIPLPPSAFTLQFFFALLSGILLGSKYGAISQSVYLLLGLLGLPVFTAGGGLTAVAQPTFGYVAGLIAVAWIAGILTRRACTVRGIAVAGLTALAILYAVGLSYMALILNVFSGQNLSFFALLLAGMLPFLPFDLLKIALVCLTAPRLRQAVGDPCQWR